MTSDEEWASKFADAGIDGWHIRVGTAWVRVACGSYTDAGAFAARVAAVCDRENHHPQIDIRYPDLVEVTTWSLDQGGLTERDLSVAAAISELFDDHYRPIA